MNSNKLRLLIFLVCIFTIGILCQYLYQLPSFSIMPKKFGLYSIKPKQYGHCACRKCLKDEDKVLGVKINSSPVPFLSKDSLISSDDFKWWKRMQDEKCNRTYFNMTMDKLFEIIPPIPTYEKASLECSRTCAVVGNSGNMKESQFGELIDTHDFVIRINRGPTKGYEEDVGTKTTHHVVFPESAVNLSSTTHLVLVTFKMRDLEWALMNFKPESENNNRSLQRTANKDLVMVLNPAFMRYVHEKWLHKRGRYPSTGMMTLIFSLIMCDEVNVFGYGRDRNGSLTHYYDIGKNMITSNHNFDNEHQVIKLLAEKQKIKLFD